jgi:hypothetical protein
VTRKTVVTSKLDFFLSSYQLTRMVSIQICRCYMFFSLTVQLHFVWFGTLIEVIFAPSSSLVFQVLTDTNHSEIFSETNMKDVLYVHI